jgi:hypothetical protein
MRHNGQSTVWVYMPVARLMRFPFRSCCIAGAFFALLLRCGSVPAAELPTPDIKTLIDKYHSIKAELNKNQFGIPLYLRSNDDSRQNRADLFGIFAYPFAEVRDALHRPADWCDIIPLHFNIKACTCGKAGDQWLLTLYAGRKFYQPPEDAAKLDFSFHVTVDQPDYLDISLDSAKGPFFTKDYQIRLEAVPLDAARTFVHFSYAFRYGLFASLAVKSYFATIERDKAGFSIVDFDNKGNPVRVGGIQGAVERNAVRYYFALQAYMDTLKSPENERFEKRIDRWYGLTARYPRQLHEMSRSEYLDAKRREHENQLKLQNKSPIKNGFSNISSPEPAGNGR